MTNTPITITLYDPKTDEVKAEYSRSFIPWEILKAAIRLMPKIDGSDPDSVDEKLIDEIAGLVAETFGNRFTAQEASKGCDMGEMLTVIQSIISRASALMPMAAANPTPPGTTRRKRH